MKLLFDLFPVILFFIAFKLYGIYTATAVAIAASIVQVSYFYLKNKTVEKMHLITLAIIVVMGGATLILQDEVFIMWKPTVINWGFALVFLGSHFIGKKPIIRRMMDGTLKLPDAVWTRLSVMWMVFFIFSGFLNLYVAYNYDTDTWVNFKLFGLMGITLVFILIQGIYISRYLKEDDNGLQNLPEKGLEITREIELDSIQNPEPRIGAQDKTTHN